MAVIPNPEIRKVFLSMQGAWPNGTLVAAPWAGAHTSGTPKTSAEGMESLADRKRASRDTPPTRTAMPWPSVRFAKARKESTRPSGYA